MSTKEEYTIEGISISMALVDTLPVIFFSGSSVLISMIFGSWIFAAGAICSALAGLGKVLWKFILAWKHKNIFILNKQMRYLMPAGFVLMLVSLIIEHDRIVISDIITAVISFPSCIFFVIGILGIIGMCILAKKMDHSSVKSNWIEQITNGIAQGSFFIELLIIMINYR